MKALDLAMQAARKRQSPHTGFVHYCHEDATSRDTIPLFENFCFALALFKTRTAENMLEAKALLEKLFAFQVEGNFPVYLHHYPDCRDSRLKDKLYPIFFYLLRDFSKVLGEDLRLKITGALTSPPEIPPHPQSVSEWISHLLASQLSGAPFSTSLPWCSQRGCYLGTQRQERVEPEVTLLDLFMGEWTGKFSRRALQDHPAHLRAALIDLGNQQPPLAAKSSATFPRYWGGHEALHSLVLETKGNLEGNQISLPEGVVEDEVEVALYANFHPGSEVWVAGARATTFQVGEWVTLISEGVKLKFRFLVEGEGKFFGHISRGNRPGQLALKGEERFAAYDWKIALRTLERKGSVTITIEEEL